MQLLSLRGASKRDEVAAANVAPDQDDDDMMLDMEEVDSRIAEAAGIIGIIDELRPLDPVNYNAAYEIWKLIARIPAEERHRLLDELSPGSIRSLWKRSVARYVLDDARALQLYSHHNVWDDFPVDPGEVFLYDGRCEQYVYRAPADPFEIDEQLQKQVPRSTPWLKPATGLLEFPNTSFTAEFFRHPQTAQLYSRVQMAASGTAGLLAGLLPGLAGRLWQRDSLYCRADVGMALTPLAGDAGADLTLVYSTPPYTLDLSRQDLPRNAWPAPTFTPTTTVSPFSGTPCDFVRAVGPGVYVGCAYRPEPGKPRELLEPNFVYFILARHL